MSKQISLFDPSIIKARVYFREKYPQFVYKMSWEFKEFKTIICSEFRCNQICSKSLTLYFDDEKDYEWFLLKWL